MIKIPTFADRAALVAKIESLRGDIPDELLRGWVCWPGHSEIMIADDPDACEATTCSFKGGLGDLLEIEADDVLDILVQKRRMDARREVIEAGGDREAQKAAMKAVEGDEDDDEGSEEIAERLAELLAIVMNNLPLLTTGSL